MATALAFVISTVLVFQLVKYFTAQADAYNAIHYARYPNGLVETLLWKPEGVREHRSPVPAQLELRKDLYELQRLHRHGALKDVRYVIDPEKFGAGVVYFGTATKTDGTKKVLYAIDEGDPIGQLPIPLRLKLVNVTGQDMLQFRPEWDWMHVIGSALVGICLPVFGLVFGFKYALQIVCSRWRQRQVALHGA